MGIGVSVFLLAVGAVLVFAVDYTANGIDIHSVGFILMAAGALGLVMTTLLFGRRDRSDGRVVTEERIVR